MRIISLVLDNIRSYEHERVDFPKGRILLSGDIGSGKSSILLAIEFALFGLMRGTISGKDVLNHSKREGRVALTVAFGEQEYILERSLKRTNTTVVQDTCSITRLGMRKDLTPSEMKAQVLALLGYPESLLTKSKGLLYRYTVFTPQEEMKQILQEHEETRLDTLRRVFAIDQYKIIKTNTQLYARTVRDDMRLAQELLKEKKDVLDEESQRLARKRDIIKNIAELLPLSEEAQIILTREKERFLNLMKQRNIFSQLNSECKVVNQRIHDVVRHQNLLRNDITRLDQELLTLSEELASFAPSVHKEQEKTFHLSRKKITDSIRLLQQQIQNDEQHTGMLQERINAKHRQTLQLQSIGECPTCLQTVPENHKEKIRKDSALQHEHVQKELLAKRERKTELTSQIKKHQDELDALLVLEKQRSVYDLKHSLKKEKEEQKSHKLKQLDDFTSKESALRTQYAELHQRTLAAQVSEDASESARLSYERQAEISKRYEMQLSSLRQEERHIAELLQRIDVKKQRFLLKEKELSEKKHISDWLSSVFIPLMDTLEIHIFATLHKQFNELFSDWLHTLVDDEQMSVRLNESFSPLIQMNGFDMDYGQLSGGERTAAALAYRLALNSVINQHVSTVRTKDLLILDEPTDGFSHAQLERMRDVLERLSLQQIIIVSHEPMMEGLVEHTIRIQKEHGKSKVRSVGK